MCVGGGGFFGHQFMCWRMALEAEEGGGGGIG